MIPAAVFAITLSAIQPVADGGAFEPLLTTPAVSKADVCRNRIIEHRIGVWRRGEPSSFWQSSDPFLSVDEIRENVVPRIVRDLEAEGCNSLYTGGFLACTELDGPPVPHLVPRGVMASNDAEMAAVMKRCLEQLAGQGVSPAP